MLVVVQCVCVVWGVILLSDTISQFDPKVDVLIRTKVLGDGNAVEVLKKTRKNTVKIFQ